MKGGRVLSVGARLRKLRAMSGAEIAHRLRYKAVIEIERRQHRAGRLVHPDRLQRALVPALRGPDWQRRLIEARRANRARFFSSVGERDAIRAIFQASYASGLADTIAKASAARHHQFAFFGREFHYGDEIPWQADPVSGREWPPVFHADVPVHGGDVGYGDVKHVWELSRHQFLIDLAKSWFLTGNRDDLQALRRLVRSWRAANPYGTGVNWSCALEPAFRVFSWLWAYSLTADALDDDFHYEWLEGLLDHGRFIERHFEHYTSPYNHLIGEASALYMLGSYLPELSDAPRWRAAAKAVMTTRLGEQFYGDGGSVEQSTFYHHATVGFYLLAGLTARVTGDELPPQIWTAVERGLDFSLALTQPDGSTPTIGGADDGKPIRMEHLPFWDFRPYLSIGAVLFNRPEMKAVAGRFHEDALWLLGTQGSRLFEALPSAPPGQLSDRRPASGYYILRSDWSPTADYVCFDCGEQAAGMRADAVPNSMHGHADCLSLVAWLGGKRVLADSGLYSYNAGGDWEAHFRETAAHNTARVDGRDQAKHLGKMAWSNSYRASPEGWHADARHSWVTGSHDGYDRGPQPVRHRRTVWLRRSAWLVVYDEFVGAGEHQYEVNYQFAPGTLQDLGGRALFDGDVEIAWTSPRAWTAAFACGGDGPAQGWIAPSLGVRVAAPRLTLRLSSAEPHVRLLTVLAARKGDGRTIRTSEITQANGDGMLATVSAGEHTDVVFAPVGSTTGPLGTDARLAACRIPRDPSLPLEIDRIGGTRLDVEAAALRRLVARVTGPQDDTMTTP
jgi:hypothetical protein